MSASDLIRRFEDRRKLVYDDATGEPIGKGSHVIGNPTIGEGFLLSPPGGLTDDEIDWIKANRLQRLEASVSAAVPGFANLTSNRQDILVCMAWQMGLHGLLEFKIMLNALYQFHWEVAAAAMLNSAWADETPDRAKELAQMMIEG